MLPVEVVPPPASIDPGVTPPVVPMVYVIVPVEPVLPVVPVVITVPVGFVTDVPGFPS